MQKGIRIRLYPNKKQINTLNIIFGHTRYVYNYFLDYSKNNKDYRYTNWSKKLTEIKNSEETKFLKEADKFALQNSLRNLQTAYDNFFSKRAKAPVFKKKHNEQAYRTNFTNNNIVLFEKGIKLPKLGIIKCKYKKDIRNNKIISVTVKLLKSGIYEASIIYECEEKALIKTGKSVGIDLGVRKLITTSNNETYISELNLDKINSKIRKEQRKLSKCELNSNNYNKQRKKLAKIYRYKDNYILDNIHKATKAIVTNYDIIYMEDLDIIDLLSKQKLKKHKRKMLTSSLGKIKTLLEYKCEHYDKTLKKIDRYYPSSQT
ncbi:MAG: transposase, partial [Acholeplasmatales bacterium]|nr:transposase [Acholeplasmatales bacterium]